MSLFRPKNLQIRPADVTSTMDITDLKDDIQSILENIFEKHGHTDLNYLTLSNAEEAVKHIVKMHIKKYNRLVIDDLYYFVDEIIFIVASAEQQLPPKAMTSQPWPIRWEQTMQKLLHAFQDYVMVLDPFTQNLKKYRQ